MPESVDVLTMGEARPLADPAREVERALDEPRGCPTLEAIVRERLRADPGAGAVVVISDNTRPVPYRGEGGILWPVLRRLLAAGLPPRRILVLVATGTHAPLPERELARLLDPRVAEAGIPIRNHDSRDAGQLAFLGKTSRGEEVYLNRAYLQAGIRVLTGLVESHFVAGVSGGRKSICPGLIGERTTYRFHGPEMIAAEGARDLNLEGNPCHEEALEVARMAGADFIVNATLDKRLQLTGVFAGHLEVAHQAAFEFLAGYVRVPFAQAYDAVVTHGGYVGINHYQSVKAALAALPAAGPGARILIVAANTDADPIGSSRYRSVLGLLTLIGAERFRRLIFSPDWTFIPEQWEVQAWARVLEKLGPEGLAYYSPQMSAGDCAFLPGVDGNRFLPEHLRYRDEPGNVQRVINGFLREASADSARRLGREPRIAFLADGPYGILTPAG